MVERPLQNQTPVYHSRREYRTAKHSLFIGKLKWAIVGLVILLSAVVVIWPLTDYGRSGFTISFEPSDHPSVGGSPAMMGPKLHGMNSNNSPYNISAYKAVQLEAKMVEMFEVDADIFLSDGTWVTLSSNKGLYDGEVREVDFKGAVNVFVDNGYEINTASAKAYMKSGEVFGHEPVVVHGPMGIIRAAGFEIRSDMSIVKFLGGVTLTAYPKSTKEE